VTAVLATSYKIPRLTRRARVALLTVHVAMSVGWVGLDGALVALEITGLSTVDPVTRTGIATAMGVVASRVLVPVVGISVISGLVLALSTPWGLVRYWWIVAKCVIAVTLTATGLLLLIPRLQQILDGDGEPARMQTLIARSAALLLLLAATGLSVIKPWGKTPRGRRPQHKPQSGPQPKAQERSRPQAKERSCSQAKERSCSQAKERSRPQTKEQRSRLQQK
jgi:hypothetical protein